MKTCSVHNVRFYRPKPKAIYCMALHKDKNIIAISRSDASIELWNIQKTPFIERTIPSSVVNFSIEGLAWFKDRLFSVGLHGSMMEYDINRLEITNRYVIIGEAAYCLDIHEGKREIVVGTEQGYLNIFKIDESEEVVFKKFLDKQEGRILCLKYDSSGDFIVSGGLDAIRIWNVETGHAVHRLTTGRSEANKATIVWCLAVTSDFTIISGDSRGKLTFWDGKIGAHVETYQSHKADILSICLSEDQSKLFCCGVDPNITSFVKIQTKNGEEKWVKSIHKRIHDHDIRSLILKGDKLYSGGIDSYLALSNDQLLKSVRYPPILQNPVATICKKARLIMLRYPKYIEIWRLGETEDNNNSKNIIPLKNPAKKLIVLQRVVKNHDNEPKKEGITFSTISDDGKYVAYGTNLGLRIFQFVLEVEETPKLLKFEDISDEDQVHFNGIFTPDGSHLITTIPSKGVISVYKLSNYSLSRVQTLENKEFTGVITSLIISGKGDYLAGADSSSNIVTWRKKDNNWVFHCKLPKYSFCPTAISMHPITSDLIVAYVDNRIMEFSVTEKIYTTLSKNLAEALPKDWANRFYSIRNIFYNNTTGHLIFHDDNSMMALEINRNNPEDIGKKMKKIKLENGKNNSFKFRVVKKYRHLVHIGLLSDSEIVAVEVSPLSLLEKLPPALARHKYGTK